MKTETIAKVCHEVNKAFCEANGDFSQKSWVSAEEWQKEAAIKGVEFSLATETNPAALHEDWMKKKTDAGWVFGEVKDAEKKTHPCLVPFDELPQFQKTKDYLFAAVVNAMKEA